MDYRLDYSMWSRVIGQTLNKAFYLLVYGLSAQPLVDPRYVGLVNRLTQTVVKSKVFWSFGYAIDTL